MMMTSLRGIKRLPVVFSPKLWKRVILTGEPSKSNSTLVSQVTPTSET